MRVNLFVRALEGLEISSIKMQNAECNQTILRQGVMSDIYIDSKMTDSERRQRLYEGALFVYSPTQATRDFVRSLRI